MGYLLGVYLRLNERADAILQERLDRAQYVELSWDAFEQSGHREEFERAMLRNKKH